jgi:hypothetical protein
MRVLLSGALASLLTASALARVVIVDIDGIRRDTFEHAYLEKKLPNFARVLGEVHDGEGFGTSLWFENARAVFPGITMAGQASIFTGVAPALHSIPGNEWYDRRTNRVIDYFSSTGMPCVYGVLLISVAECSGGLANRHLQAPTIYEAATRAGKTSTVVFNAYWKGATHAVLPTLEEVAGLVHNNAVNYETFDVTMMDRALASLNTDGVPDLLTIYFIGADGIGHLRGTHGQVGYLVETVDVQFGRLLDALEERDPEWRADTQFIITSDHGRTDSPAAPEDAKIEAQMQAAIEAAGFPPDQYRIVENGGVVHVYLRSRLSETEDVAKALADDADLCEVTEAVAYRGNGVYSLVGGGRPELAVMLSTLNSPKSGDVLVLLKHGRYFGDTSTEGAQHGSVFDSDLEVPLVVALGGAPGGRSPVAVSIADVPKIVAAYLGFTF